MATYKNPSNTQVEKLLPGDIFIMEGTVCITSYGGMTLWTYENIPADYVALGPASVTVVIPEGFNGVEVAVAAIEAKITQYNDEFIKKAAPLREKKAELLQLTYQGAAILDAQSEDQLKDILDDE